MRIRYFLVLLFAVLSNLIHAQINDTITYVGVTNYEIENSSIEKIKKPKIINYQGSYHFGESEGESQLEIIYSNGKLFARTEYSDWEQNTWVLKINREPIKYSNGEIKIGETSYKLYKCIKTTYLTLNEGQKGLVSYFFENLNGKNYHYIQFNEDNKIKLPKGQHPETSFVKLTDNDLLNYSKYDLKIMRNEIFARNGYIFKQRGEMDNFFSKKEWYNYIEKTDKPILNDIEKHNVSLILKLEQK
ncbi:YARHG domain-containing protein [Aquimarina sp. AU58]|uniref:YARHG domain-containing protein n=1 Tax=Aquimarina sp. AU58 TaxID=1874112 RepID=UPI000D6E99A9|nr:YARHG domain-containing protein [Aquimarina sp. AU58]